MRKSLAVLLAAAMVVGLLVFGSIALAATKTVRVRQPNRWAVSSVTINKRDTVRWTWSGRVPHNVKGPGFQSRTARSLTYRRTFRRSGSYSIVCTVHRTTMKMRVRVR
jgi:plastocyanin